MKPGSNDKFSTCKHKWQLHVPADRCSGPCAGNSMFICKECTNIITLSEKCAIEEVELLRGSVLIQEKHTRIGMWANIISAFSLIIAAGILLLGDRILF